MTIDKPNVVATAHESGRGNIADNALKALVTSPLFRTRTEKAKKGKGSYNRKAQQNKGHQGDAPFDMLGLRFLSSPLILN